MCAPSATKHMVDIEMLLIDLGITGASADNVRVMSATKVLVTPKTFVSMRKICLVDKRRSSFDTLQFCVECGRGTVGNSNYSTSTSMQRNVEEMQKKEVVFQVPAFRLNPTIIHTYSTAQSLFNSSGKLCKIEGIN